MAMVPNAPKLSHLPGILYRLEPPSSSTLTVTLTDLDQRWISLSKKPPFEKPPHTCHSWPRRIAMFQSALANLLNAEAVPQKLPPQVRSQTARGGNQKNPPQQSYSPIKLHTNRTWQNRHPASTSYVRHQDLPSCGAELFRPPEGVVSF